MSYLKILHFLENQKAKCILVSIFVLYIILYIVDILASISELLDMKAIRSKKNIFLIEKVLNLF